MFTCLFIASLAIAQAPAPAQATTVNDRSTPVDLGQLYPGTQLWPAGYEQSQETAPSASTSAEAPAAPAAPTEPARRALPAPLESPPFPSGEWQGYPLIGVPYDTTRWALMKELQGTWPGDLLDSERIRVYGWVNVSGNVSTADHSNSPTSYWLVPNSVQLDQLVVRAERQLDTVQTDHIDWGFRSTFVFGTDYRYLVSGGWEPASTELLKHNLLYGEDLTEQYVDMYVPWVAQGMVLQVGRWIATPDIETQFAPDNYLGTHSILFTFDTYTQTGVMSTVMLNQQWMVQAAICAGTDMAPWYTGAIPTGMAGVRWVSKSNNDSIYFVFNEFNNTNFRQFLLNGQPAGHDDFNYPVITWQHRFNEIVHTKQEAYFMWQNNAFVGGTASIGPVRSFGGGGGLGAPIPGTALTYGTVNYTMFMLSPKSFLTLRNEYWRDEDGERSGFPGTYTSHTVGVTYNFTPSFQVRPEIGYYRNWTMPAFDLGTKQGIVIAGLDVTLRF
jgi:Putative beta-barrel porin-2, OmpL-like. bbp2